MSHLIRPLVAREAHEPGRVATPLEIFYDLVAVISIAAVTAAYHHEISYGHGLETLVQFSLGIMAVWWVWANFTWFASSFDNHDTLYRVLVFTNMAGFALFAAGAEFIFDTNDAETGVIGWIIMRAALVLLWLRAAKDNPDYRGAALTYAIGLTLLQIGWYVMYVEMGLRGKEFYITSVILMAGEFAVPILAGRLFRHPPLHRHHMVERHGLLNIIVLGEIILGATLFFAHLHSEGAWEWHHFWGGMITIAIACMMWLYYFIEDDHVEAIASGRHFGSWAYLHVVVYGAGALMGATAAAQMDVLDHHSKADPQVLAFLTNAAVAGYIFGLWLIRDRFLSNGMAHWTPLAGIALLLITGWLALPYWATAAILFVALSLRMTARIKASKGAPS